MLTPDTLPTVVFHRTRLAVPSPISCPLIADSAMTIARSAREDRACESAVFVLSRETKSVFRSLVLQSSARDPGFHCSLRSRGSRLESEVVVLSRETKSVFRSLVLQSSARDPGFHCSLRSRGSRLESEVVVRSRETKSVFRSFVPPIVGARSWVAFLVGSVSGSPRRNAY